MGKASNGNGKPKLAKSKSDRAARNNVWRKRIVGYGDEDPRKLKANDANWRLHPQAQHDAMDGALDEIGWIQDIIVNLRTSAEWGKAERNVKTTLDGHLRVERALAKNEASVPVKFVDLTPQEELTALATFDPLSAMAQTDGKKLQEALARLEVESAGLQALTAQLEQQAQDAIAALGVNAVEETADVGELIDRAAELQKKWKVEKGDIWTAAGHYWICGDCREFETWAKLLRAADVEKVNGVFTSPPYAEQRKKQYGGVPTAKYVEWWAEVQSNARAHLAQDGSFFVNIKPHCENGERVLYVFDLVLAMQRQWGWKYIDEFCWLRNSYPTGNDDRFKNYFEPVYQFATSGTPIRFENVSLGEYRGKDLKTKSGTMSGLDGGSFSSKHTRPSNVIEAHGVDSGIAQAAQFPAALPAFFIKAYSDIGGAWLDPFLGSGTTIVAAHRNERKGLGIETLEKYVAVICERLQQLGLEPRRVTETEKRNGKQKRA